MSNRSSNSSNGEQFDTTIYEGVQGKPLDYSVFNGNGRGSPSVKSARGSPSKAYVSNAYETEEESEPVYLLRKMDAKRGPRLRSKTASNKSSMEYDVYGADLKNVSPRHAESYKMSPHRSTPDKRAALLKQYRYALDEASQNNPGTVFKQMYQHEMTVDSNLFGPKLLYLLLQNPNTIASILKLTTDKGAKLKLLQQKLLLLQQKFDVLLQQDLDVSSYTMVAWATFLAAIGKKHLRLLDQALLLTASDEQLLALKSKIEKLTITDQATARSGWF